MSKCYCRELEVANGWLVSPCSSDYWYSSHKYRWPVSTSQQWLLLLHATDSPSCQVAIIVAADRWLVSPSRRVAIIVAADRWSVSPSRRVLEAAKIRNEHLKIQGLYENKQAHAGNQVVATRGNNPYTSQVATCSTKLARIDYMTAVVMCHWAVIENLIESMDGSLHTLKYNLKLVTEIRKVHHWVDDEVHDIHWAGKYNINTPYMSNIMPPYTSCYQGTHRSHHYIARTTIHIQCHKHIYILYLTHGA